VNARARLGRALQQTAFLSLVFGLSLFAFCWPIVSRLSALAAYWFLAGAWLLAVLGLALVDLASRRQERRDSGGAGPNDG